MGANRAATEFPEPPLLPVIYQHSSALRDESSTARLPTLLQHVTS